MGILRKGSYCKECERKTMHERVVFSDLGGCLLTLLTLGLFLPIWFLYNVFQPWRCQSCGRARGMFG